MADGVAVPGPKGERGDPGPASEGKAGKNVRERENCTFAPVFICVSVLQFKETSNLVLQGKPGLPGVLGPVGPKGSKVGFLFVSRL